MPRRSRTPPEKKRLSLAKDTPLSAKYPKAFRTSWPLKKARAERAYRHARRQALVVDPDNDVPPALREVRKWTQPKLGEVIVARRARRAAIQQQPRKSPAARDRRRARRSRKRVVVG